MGGETNKKTESFRFTAVSMESGVGHKPEEMFKISYLSEGWSILPLPRGLCQLSLSQNRLNQTNMFNST